RAGGAFRRGDRSIQLASTTVSVARGDGRRGSKVDTRGGASRYQRLEHGLARGAPARESFRIRAEAALARRPLRYGASRGPRRASGDTDHRNGPARRVGARKDCSRGRERRGGGDTAA